MKQFEEMTIKDLKELTEQYMKEHPKTKTAQDFLDELFEEREK